jgi:predicted transcriptional regulator
MFIRSVSWYFSRRAVLSNELPGVNVGVTDSLTSVNFSVLRTKRVDIANIIADIAKSVHPKFPLLAIYYNYC